LRLRAFKKSYCEQPKAHPIFSSYFILRLFARLEGCLFRCWSRLPADGAGSYSVSADLVSGDKLIAAIHAGYAGKEKIAVRRKDGTANATKGKKPTVKPKIVADMV
jgi:hypothetical protein